MATTQIITLPPSVGVLGTDWIPLQRTGEEAQRIQLSDVVALTTGFIPSNTTLTTNQGIQGGGLLSSGLTISVDVNSITTATEMAVADSFPINSVSAGNLTRQVTFPNAMKAISGLPPSGALNLSQDKFVVVKASDGLAYSATASEISLATGNVPAGGITGQALIKASNTDYDTVWTTFVPANVTVANEATDATCFINFTTAATGALGIKTNANLTFDSSTGVLTAGQTIVGSISGNAGTVTWANEAADTTCFIGFATAASGSLAPKTNTNMTFNASTGVATFASTVLTTTDVNGGTIDNTVIGGATPAAGSFTIVTADAGTVSAPGIAFASEPNTGMYMPAADTIGFAAGGVKAMSATADQLTVTKAIHVGSESALPTGRFFRVTGSAPITSAGSFPTSEIISVLNPGSASSTEFRVFNMESQPDAVGVSFSTIYAIHCANRVVNSGAISELVGGRFFGAFASTSAASLGTITNATGIMASAVSSFSNSLTSTISNAFGVRVANNINIGSGPLTITKTCGIAIDNQTSGTNNTDLLVGTATIPTGNFGLYNSSSKDNYIAGKVGIGTSSPSVILDVNDDSVRIRTSQTPASATAAGVQGEIAWDATYIYICIATNTWRRVAHATW